MLLYCVRHGESVYNAEGRIQGQSDVPLSELGMSQADAVATAMAEVSIDVVFSSPLLRARQTAEVVAARLDVPLHFDPRLKEIHAGVFQDQRRSELEKTHAEELARWRSEDLDYAIPGGETRRELMARGRLAFESIARSGHEQIAVIAHGRLLVVTLKHLVGIAPDEPPVALENGSITTIAFNGGQRFHAERWNQIDHLDGVGRSSSGDL